MHCILSFIAHFWMQEKVRYIRYIPLLISHCRVRWLSCGICLHRLLAYNCACARGRVRSVGANGGSKYVCRIASLFLKTWVCVLTAVPQFYSIWCFFYIQFNQLFTIAHCRVQVTLCYPIIDSFVVWCDYSVKNSVFWGFRSSGMWYRVVGWVVQTNEKTVVSICKRKRSFSIEDETAQSFEMLGTACPCT